MRNFNVILSGCIIFWSSELLASPYLIPVFRHFYQTYQHYKYVNNNKIKLKITESFKLESVSARRKNLAGQSVFQDVCPVTSSDQQISNSQTAEPFKTIAYEEDLRSPWPRVVIQQHVNASPERAAEVFSDFESYKEFVPACQESTVQDAPDSDAVRDHLVFVEYAFNLPYGIGKRKYIIQNELTLDESTGTYGVDWEKVQTPESSDGEIEGSVKFLPDGNGTLMIYSEIIIPAPSSFFNWSYPTFVNALKKVVEKKVEVIVERIEGNSGTSN
jgi:hypothetical protein